MSAENKSRSEVGVFAFPIEDTSFEKWASKSQALEKIPLAVFPRGSNEIHTLAVAKASAGRRVNEIYRSYTCSAHVCRRRCVRYEAPRVNRFPLSRGRPIVAAVNYSNRQSWISLTYMTLGYEVIKSRADRVYWRASINRNLAHFRITTPCTIDFRCSIDSPPPPAHRPIGSCRIRSCVRLDREAPERYEKRKSRPYTVRELYARLTAHLATSCTTSGPNFSRKVACDVSGSRAVQRISRIRVDRVLREDTFMSFCSSSIEGMVVSKQRNFGFPRGRSNHIYRERIEYFI